MTQDYLNDRIIDLQCKHVTLTSKLVNYLSIGSQKVVCYNRKNVSVAHMLGTLRRYTAFTGEVTFATKIEFNRIQDGSVSIDLILEARVYNSYVGTGDGEAIAAYFENEINTDAIPVIDYETVVRVGNTLYIYSYDVTATFADTVLTSISNTALVTSTITNLQNSTSDILDLWNTVTSDEVCCMLKFGLNQVKVEVGANGSNPCNC